MAIEAQSPLKGIPLTEALLIRPKQNWQFICRTIVQIAVHLFISLSSGYLLYAALPISFHATLLPIALFSIVFAASFLFTSTGVSSSVRPFFCPSPNPLPGIDNASQNCWINALAQTICCDEGMKEWFSHFPQEWLPQSSAMDQMPEAIRDIPFLTPQMLLAVRDAAINEDTIQAYRRQLEQSPHASRYIQFFAGLSAAERSTRWKGLVTFCQFLHACQAAEDQRWPIVPFQSQRLRFAIHALNALIGSSPQSQEDPMEGLTTIGDYLLPDDLKVSIEERRIYPQEGLPRRESLQIGCMQLSISGEHPNIQRMVDQEQRFVTAPSALWLHLKRMYNAQPQEGQAPILRKLLTPVLAEDQVRIQTIESIDRGSISYQLDSFIVHVGDSLNTGHYKSYRMIQGVWFEMNDKSVRQITLAEKEEASKQAYVYHYSQVR